MAGHRFKPEKANKLINEKRYELLPPIEILERFGVKKGDIVADLGAGNGFFTLPIAKITQVTVFAIDIEPEMLRMLKARARNEGVTGIQAIVSDLNHIKLPDQSVDKILISFVIHEVPDLKLTLSEMKRILRQNGSAMVIEWEAKETEGGPPLHERISAEDLRTIVSEQGFKVEQLSLNEANYGLILR